MMMMIMPWMGCDDVYADLGSCYDTRATRASRLVFVDGRQFRRVLDLLRDEVGDDRCEGVHLNVCVGGEEEDEEVGSAEGGKSGCWGTKRVN